MELNKRSTVYIFLFMFIAVVALVFLATNYPLPDIKTLIVWSCMSALAVAFQIRLPNKMLNISAGYAVAMGVIVIGNPLTATLVQALGLIFAIRRKGDKFEHILNTPFYKTAFNLSQRIITITAMGLLYEYFGGSPGVLLFMPALFVHVLGMFINIFIVSGFWTLMGRGGIWDIWKISFDGIFLINVFQGVYGTIIALVSITNELLAAFLFFATLYVVGLSFKQQAKISNNCMATMQIINRLVEAKDSYTFGHASRVEELSVQLARALGYKQHDVERIRRAALLHDIGKIGIHDAILNKPGRLTHEEYHEVKKHPVIGAEIVAGASFLKDTIGIILHHHERYDGQGYPDGLKGQEIPCEASIVAIADAYDAMTSDRPYRKALSKDLALQEIKDLAGKQFHPEFAEVFLKLMEEPHDFVNDYSIC